MSSAILTPELTEERMAEAMARAETVACSPGDDRCERLLTIIARALPETARSDFGGAVDDRTSAAPFVG
jgi:hypothetical protein